MDGTALTIYHIRMQLTGFLRKNNAIFLRISGGVGFVLGLLYFPGTPLYILGTLTEREIGVWAGLIMILSTKALHPKHCSVKPSVQAILISPLCILSGHLPTFWPWSLLPSPSSAKWQACSIPVRKTPSRKKSYTSS